MTSLLLNVPLSLVAILGILFNGYIVIAVLLTKQVATANNILLLHLGVVDTLLGILALAFSAPGLSNAATGLPCVLHGFLYMLLHSLILWTVCGLNCDRYYAIAAPLHYSHIVNSKKVLIGLGAGWVISLIFCIPPLFALAPHEQMIEIAVCIPNFYFGRGTLWFSTLYTAFTLLLPTTLIICCNLKILMIARYHRHRIASAIYEVTLSAQVTITHQRNPFFVPTVTAPGSGGPKFRGRSAMYTVFQLVGSLLVLYLPYYSLVMGRAIVCHFSAAKIHPHFTATTAAILICSPPVNAFLYGVKNKTIRKALQNYWRKKQTKSEVKEEIQARTPSTCGSRRPSYTPLGLMARPTLQRRMSETLLDVHKNGNRQKLKKIALGLNWRPVSATNLTILKEPPKIKQTASCNALPRINDEHDLKSGHTSGGFLQKFFGPDRDKDKGKPTVEKSPKITITRAFSEESESQSNSPARELSKRHSTSTTLLEKKWRQLRAKDEEGCVVTTRPLLDDRSSDSSEETSRTFQDTEEHILFNWTHHKKQANMMKHNLHAQEMVLQ